MIMQALTTAVHRADNELSLMMPSNSN